MPKIVNVENLVGQTTGGHGEHDPLNPTSQASVYLDALVRIAATECPFGAATPKKCKGPCGRHIAEPLIPPAARGRTNE